MATNTNVTNPFIVVDECLVETLRLFGDNAPIPSGPLDVVQFPGVSSAAQPRIRATQPGGGIQPPGDIAEHRRPSVASTGTTVSSVGTASTDEDYTNSYTSDGFEVSLKGSFFHPRSPQKAIQD